MRVISSAPFSRLSRRQGILYVPDNVVAVPTPNEATGLLQAGVKIAKNVGAGAVAKGAWDLTTVPATTDQQALAKWLVSKSVPELKAPSYASDLHQLLSNPAVRTVMFGVSGGAATYLVVENTSWSTRTKWLVTLVGALVSGAAYLILRKFEIIN